MLLSPAVAAGGPRTIPPSALPGSTLVSPLRIRDGHGQSIEDVHPVIHTHPRSSLGWQTVTKLLWEPERQLFCNPVFGTVTSRKEGSENDLPPDADDTEAMIGRPRLYLGAKIDDTFGSMSTLGPDVLKDDYGWFVMGYHLQGARERHGILLSLGRLHPPVDQAIVPFENSVAKTSTRGGNGKNTKVSVPKFGTHGFLASSPVSIPARRPSVSCRFATWRAGLLPVTRRERALARAATFSATLE